MSQGDATEFPVELLDDGVEISAVVRSAYVLAHVRKFQEIIETADKIYAGFPRSVRESVESINCGDEDSSLDTATRDRLALTFAKHPQSVRDLMRVMLNEISLYIGVWFDQETEEGEYSPALYGVLDEDDVAVIEEMVTFVQKVGRRSTRQLLAFLRAANDGDWAYLLVQSKNRESEIRTRERISESSRSEFGIE